MEGLRLHPRLTGTVKAAITEGEITLHTVDKRTGHSGAPVQFHVGKGAHFITDIIAINLSGKFNRMLLALSLR